MLVLLGRHRLRFLTCTFHSAAKRRNVIEDSESEDGEGQERSGTRSGSPAAVGGSIGDDSGSDYGSEYGEVASLLLERPTRLG